MDSRETRGGRADDVIDLRVEPGVGPSLPDLLGEVVRLADSLVDTTERAVRAEERLVFLQQRLNAVTTEHEQTRSALEAMRRELHTERRSRGLPGSRPL